MGQQVGSAVRTVEWIFLIKPVKFSEKRAD